MGLKSSMFVRQIRKAMEMKNLLIVNFMCLCINLFLVVMQLNKGFYPVEIFFQPVMKSNDRNVMTQILRAFVGALESNNLTYFMYSGTLIGSFRHHGPIPWDDDIDIMLNASQKAQVREALQKLRPDYDLHTGSGDILDNTAWKFFSVHLSNTFIHRPFKWPYIDMFFFNENQTHIWDDMPGFSKEYNYPKVDIFPLTKRPFGDLKLPAPCDANAILKKNYQIEICRSRTFSHLMEMPMFTFDTKDVPCSRLAKYFPFVYRTYIDGTMNETLKIGDWSLKSFLLPSYCPGRHP